MKQGVQLHKRQDKVNHKRAEIIHLLKGIAFCQPISDTLLYKLLERI